MKALLSAYRKNDTLRRFANELTGLGWELAASSGTKDQLDKWRIPATDVAEMVGPPILGHRVVTLSREVHAAILADLTETDQREELAQLGIEPFGLVYVDLYPLEEEMQSPTRTAQSVLNKIDIGGPALLRSAAKGRRYCVCNPAQCDEVLSFLKAPPNLRTGDGAIAYSRFLAKLAAEAERRVSDYSAVAAEYYEMVAAGTFRDRS